MKRMLVRYKAKPEQVEENAHLIENVFHELRAQSPAGLRYLALRLADGSFLHLVTTEDGEGASPLAALPAFRDFQSGISERCAEPPQTSGATIVGNYRMLGE
jgi:hypothetical protein